MVHKVSRRVEGVTRGSGKRRVDQKVVGLRMESLGTPEEVMWGSGTLVEAPRS